MKYEQPESLADLTQTLVEVNRELTRTLSSLQTGAGIGTAEMIRSAYEYAEHEGHEARGVDALGQVQGLAEALTRARAHVKELGRQTRLAVQAVHERGAQIAAAQASAAKLRG